MCPSAQPISLLRKAPPLTRDSVASSLAPEEGFEPPTRRLTAACSTPELLRNGDAIHAIPDPGTSRQEAPSGLLLLGHVLAEQRIDAGDDLFRAGLARDREVH